MIPSDITKIVDTSVFSSIAVASQETAKNTTLGTYDYWTIAIAVIACIVSLGSLYIAGLTLVSQRKTEMNTSLMGKDKLQDMLVKLLGLAYINMIRSTVIYNKWSAANFEGYPHNDIVSYMRFPLSYIKAERCSGLNSDQYVGLLELSRVLSDYNSRLETKFANFQNPAISRELHERDIVRLQYESTWLVKRHIDTLMQLNNALPKGDGEETMEELMARRAAAKVTLERCMNKIRITSSAFNEDCPVTPVPCENLPASLEMLYGYFEGDEKKTELNEMIAKDIAIMSGKNKRIEDFVCMVK